MYLISFLFGFGILISLSLADLSPQLKCFAKIEKEIKGLKVTKTLGSLVGIGWNDITYTEALPVFATNFNECETTPDGDFLIPDGVTVLPIKESNIQETAEKYETFSDFKSKHSFSFDAHGGAEFKGFGISGSMSDETKTAKEHMEKHSRTGFSKKLEYHAFDLTASENGGFDKGFTDRLKAVADGINNGKMLLAQHEAERIIADFGTHVINKASVGAKAVIYGFTTVNSVTDSIDIQNKMSAKFDAKFKGVVNGGFKISDTTEESTQTGSSTTEMHFYTRGHGGISTDGDANAIGTKMKIDSVVGLKRSGVPIYSLIHEGALEHFNASNLELVREMIENATRDYYRHNYIPGCTNPISANYFFKANAEDGSCKEVEPIKLPERTKEMLLGVAHRGLFDVYGYIDEYVMTYCSKRNVPIFGGVYQQCEYISSSSKIHSNLEHGNHCDQYNHPNPFTAGYSCPLSHNVTQEVGKFYATLKDRFDNVKDESCNSTECSKNYPITDKLLIKTYWCAEFKIQKGHQSIIDKILSDTEMILEALDDGQDALISKHIIATSGGVINVRVDTPDFVPKIPEPGLYGIRFPNRIESVELIEKALANNKTQLIMYNKGESKIFGGIFEKQNVFSDNGRCENGFKEYPFFHNLKICLGTADENNIAKSVEFGGMISCHNSKQECPEGLSKYLATIINGCTYHYCASVVNRGGFKALTGSKQPPYIDQDMVMSKVRFGYEEENDEAEDAKK